MAAMAERWAYHLWRTARAAWFWGQNRAAQRIEGGRAGPRPTPTAAERDEGLALRRAYRALIRRDWSNIAAGYYRLPDGLLADPRRALADSARFFRDLPAVQRRRRERGAHEIAAGAGAAGLPAYYRQNFHYQTDGYLSPHSARLYDHQVEVLFWGAADAMRRQALVPIHFRLHAQGVRGARLLDVACGTGAFLADLRDNYPRLGLAALDLSAPYLAEARRRLAGRHPVALLQGQAEALPIADASQDIVTCIYLFHELPAAVQAAVAAEVARVLKPGGLLVQVDSLQQGDVPALDPALERFPKLFHEPYYARYVCTDLNRLFGAVGLTPMGSDLAFMSKVATFMKPAG